MWLYWYRRCTLLPMWLYWYRRCTLLPMWLYWYRRCTLLPMWLYWYRRCACMHALVGLPQATEREYVYTSVLGATVNQ